MPSKNPQVYLDIAIGNSAGGRVTFELFADVTPRTAENFRGLCTGEFGVGRNTKRKLSYEGCTFFRSVKGFMVQSGDFVHNNGDGGESIYGGSFNDEDFTRRHTQAGVLSMANRGRNTNTSQFFITLARAPQLDGKHIAFGQVTAGMDIIRAVAQVPTDRDEKPRVLVKIVGAGELSRKHYNQADPRLKLAASINDMNEEQAPTGAKLTEAQKGKSIIAGKQGGAPIKNSSSIGDGGDDEDEDEAEEGGRTAPAAPRNERERKLFELRLKMNQSRSSNNKEVIEEQKRQADPDYSRRKAEERHKRAMEKGDDESGSGQKPGTLPDGKEYLNDTVESVEMRAAKKKKGNPDAFGWDVFNQDSLYRAHDKRLKSMKFDEEAYSEQKKQEGEVTSNLFGGFGYKATEEQKDRLQQAMDKMAAKKKEFSRRRSENLGEEDVTYVNDRNRHFNKKMDRFFGEYTKETKQNLERGTAL